VSTPDPRPGGPVGDPLSAGPPGGAAGPSAAGAGTGPAGAVQPPAPAEPTRHTGRSIRRTLAAALLVFVTVVLVLFVVFNTQSVDISLVFGDVNAPLVVALLIAAVLGGLVVGLADAMMTVRGRRRNR
jgi:uncharacterized integral membrane protein